MYVQMRVCGYVCVCQHTHVYISMHAVVCPARLQARRLKSGFHFRPGSNRIESRVCRVCGLVGTRGAELCPAGVILGVQCDGGAHVCMSVLSWMEFVAC